MIQRLYCPTYRVAVRLLFRFPTSWLRGMPSSATSTFSRPCCPPRRASSGLPHTPSRLSVTGRLWQPCRLADKELLRGARHHIPTDDVSNRSHEDEFKGAGTSDSYSLSSLLCHLSAYVADAGSLDSDNDIMGFVPRVSQRPGMRAEHPQVPRQPHMIMCRENALGYS